MTHWSFIIHLNPSLEFIATSVTIVFFRENNIKPCSMNVSIKKILVFSWVVDRKKNSIRESVIEKNRITERTKGQLSDTTCIQWQWSVSHAKRQWIQSYSKRWRSIALGFMYQEDTSAGADLPIYIHPATVGSSIKFTVWKSAYVS